MRNILTLISLLLICYTLLSCKKRQEFNKAINVIANSATEDFDPFYDRFHRDSIFQLSRIKFPLLGSSVDSDGEMKWSNAHWDILRTKIYDIDTTIYNIDYKKTTHAFWQKFWIPNSGFWGEYRFEVINSKWYLVYRQESSL